MKVIPVIISGGSGSRLWPLSTSQTPKPFLPLFSNSNLLEKTLERLSGLFATEVLLVTNQKHLELHQKSIQKTKLSCFFLLEDEGKNTAPAILMAARFLQSRGLSEQLMLVLPADQFILEIEKFYCAVQIAVRQAQIRGLVTFGVKPSYPETGYGYLCTEKEPITSHVFRVIEFIEKPNSIKAQEFFKQKNYFWNSGMFCFSVKNILQAFDQYQKQMSKNSLECLKKSVKVGNDRLYFDPETFRRFDSISLDYAIMEKHSEVFAVRADFKWSDIGSWYSVANLFKKDEDGNVLQGKHFSLENKNVFLLAKKHFFGLLGLEDISIIEGEQNILIAHKDKLQEVKNIFQFVTSKEAEAEADVEKKQLSIFPEIFQLTLQSKEKYNFRTTSNCSIINIGLNSNSLFIEQKEKKLQKGEGIFITKNTGILFENNTKKLQQWVSIQIS